MCDDRERHQRAEREVAEGASRNSESDKLHALLLENITQTRLLREDLAGLLEEIRAGQRMAARGMAETRRRQRALAGPLPPGQARAVVDLAATGEAEPPVAGGPGGD